MSEALEHSMICSYMRTNFPHVVFLSDASGIKMTMGQAIKWKGMRSGNGIPDLIILQPSKQYYGLMIELKKTGEKIYKKDGSLKTDHLKEQATVLSILRIKGYKAEFAIGFTQARDLIIEYMKQ